MTDAERQRDYIAMRFINLNPGINPTVEQTDDETIIVYPMGTPNRTDRFWLMEIGSDDDRYRFELWVDGRDTGIYVEFAFEGETL